MYTNDYDFLKIGIEYNTAQILIFLPDDRPVLHYITKIDQY